MGDQGKKDKGKREKQKKAKLTLKEKKQLKREKKKWLSGAPFNPELCRYKDNPAGYTGYPVS